MSDPGIVNEEKKTNRYTNGLLCELERLVEAGEAGDFSVVLEDGHLSREEAEVVRLVNKVIGKYRASVECNTVPEEIREGLGRINMSCSLLLGIINDVLDFSKIVETGKLEINPAKYEVASLINGAVHNVNAMCSERKLIKLAFEIDENIPASLIGDELRIKQILNNLLSSAFKSTDAGTVTLSAAFESEPGKEGIMLVFGVRDTGKGMAKERMEALFGEYSRFDQESGSFVEGTEPALAIARRLTELMGGEIHAESEPGKGSLFTVRLPQKTAGSGVLGKALVENLQQLRPNNVKSKKKSPVTYEPMPYGSILIVDDVETNICAASGHMKPYRLQIDTAMSGFEAIEKIKAGKVYDIVFMDHMMPEMDGIETTKNLRGLGYTSPIVALTATLAGQENMFLQNGFDDYMSKPIDARRLNAVLTKLVRDKQPPDVIEAARLQKSDEPDSGDEQLRENALLLQSFMRDARKTIALLHDLFQNPDFENEGVLQKFTATVHGIKSALANIGESELSGVAFKLEQAGRTRNIEFIEASASEFLKDLCELAERLDPQQDDEAGVDEDIEALRDRLLAIQGMCADYNRKGAMELLVDVKGCSKKTRAIFDSIREYVHHSDFDEAESAAATYAATLGRG